MKRLCLSLLVLLLCYITAQSFPYAFKRKSSWNKGMVVLHNGDTIYGQLKFTRKVSEGLLQLMRGRNVEVLTVKDVLSFSYYDKNKKTTRRFLTLTFLPEQSTREHEIFIEYIYGNNKLSLLNYKALGFSDHAIQINPFRTKTVVNRRYLLDNKTGKIVPLNKTNCLDLMEQEKKDILSFLQASGMRLKTVEDYISLLDYHQTLIVGI